MADRYTPELETICVAAALPFPLCHMLIGCRQMLNHTVRNRAQEENVALILDRTALSDPDGGRMRSLMLNRTIRIRPNQKLGMACPVTERNKATRSMMLLGRTAAATPNGTAVKSANEIPHKPSNIVTDRRSATNCDTGNLK